MAEASSHVISVRAIEDIIQIQKLIEEVPNLKSIQLKNEKSNERVVYSILKHGAYSPETGNKQMNAFLKECDMENSFKCNDVNCKKDIKGWESDCGLTKYMNPDVVVLENIGIIEGTASDPDVKYWSSDSDVTVLRVRKEFRNELSNRVEWEEQRNLADDESISSMNLDWESHSLINLAGITDKEKDIQENLTPFTIWSKNATLDPSMVLMENMNSMAGFEPNIMPEVRLAVENCIKSESNHKNHLPKKEKKIRKLLRGVFSCFIKKKSF